MAAIVAVTVAALLGVFAALAVQVTRRYPGFFFSIDYRVFPVSADSRAAGLRYGDKILTVDGQSPLELMTRVQTPGRPVHYEVRHDGRRVAVDLSPFPFGWRDLIDHFGVYFVVSIVMLAVGLLVFGQNPAGVPNRNFLIYMCLWAVSNVAVPEAVLGSRKYAAILVSFVPPLLSVHGWIVFLTYPVNPPRQAWLERHRVIPRLYRIALAAGLLMSLTFAAVYMTAPALLNQQITVLILGIGLGLGCWLALMLAPLIHYYEGPVDPQWGSALVLLYPLAIAYATVRYRLFDASVVIRRSVVYTMLAGVITGAYALVLAVTNLLLAQSELTRSRWFSAGFMFAVALAFNPLREWVRRAVDRTFFRERYDYARTIQALARSMRSLLDLEEITRRLTGTIESVMHVRAARLSLDTPPAAVAAVLDAAPGALSRYQVAADPRVAGPSAEALTAYAAWGAEVIVPLRFQDELRGLLLLGPKRSEAAFTAEDLELLEALADQAAVAVANAEAHRQVVDYARELERSLMIRTTLAKFVPSRVRQLIEESPEAPLLDKRETEVTVLFSDISGYTRLSARLAPDDLDALWSATSARSSTKSSSTEET